MDRPVHVVHIQRQSNTEKKGAFYVRTLCRFKPNRSTGSKGNRAAAAFCAKTLRGFGYAVETAPFACLDFNKGEAMLTHDGECIPVLPSPFSLGCDVEAELTTASTLEELKASSRKNKLLLLRGDICSEQLMPKRFGFYNPDHHKSFYGLMEGKPWYQGGHMIFAQNGIPAIAFTSEKMKILMSQITHTPKDTPDIIDYQKLVETASAVKGILMGDKTSE
jgi:Iap family predicted aminopeptidase